MSFKDALDLFLVTFPYWSVAERITESIINPYVSLAPEHNQHSTRLTHGLFGAKIIIDP
jgi:hypothetical protein